MPRVKTRKLGGAPRTNSKLGQKPILQSCSSHAYRLRIHPPRSGRHAATRKPLSDHSTECRGLLRRKRSSPLNHDDAQLRRNVRPSDYVYSADRKAGIESMSSKYQQNSANCMRLAGETNDAVLSIGYMKMAQAWSDLEKRRRTMGRLKARHTGSRQVNRQRTKAMRKPTERRIRSSLSH